MSESQIIAFEDTWHWTEESEWAYDEVIKKSPNYISEMMRSFRQFLGQNDYMAYLTMMCIRMVELRRVLKDSGSIYLHCDPTASHYLKILMDAVFGQKNYLNEIVWCYKEREIAKRYWNKKHNVILFYCKNIKNNERVFNWKNVVLPYSPGSKKKYNLTDTDEKGKLYQIRGKGGSYVGEQQLPRWVEEEHPEWTYRDYWEEKEGIPPEIGSPNVWAQSTVQIAMRNLLKNTDMLG